MELVSVPIDIFNPPNTSVPAPFWKPPCENTTLLPGCWLQARNMRLLERTDLGACRVLVADSSSNRVAGDVEVPTGGAAVYQMPRFSEVSPHQA